MTFGEYLRHCRKEAGVSMRGLARALGLSHSYLYEVEVGERPPLPLRHWYRLRNIVEGIQIAEMRRLALDYERAEYERRVRRWKASLPM